MKQIKFFLFLLVLVPLAGFAQTGPKFVVDGGDIISTGSHMRGTEVHYEIKFKNEGDADLKIQSVTTSCGCSTALASEDIIKPGEAGTINFTFNGNGMGMVTKGVYVTTNETSGTNPRTLSVNMNMVDPVAIAPNSIITDGKVGDELKQTATITNNFDKAITISEISSNSPAVKVTSDKNSLEIGEVASVNISIKLYEESAVNAAIIIKTDAGEFQIPILVDVKAK